MGCLLNPYVLGGSVPLAVFELDAGLATSYAGGSAQAFANTVTDPADGQDPEDYDFVRGASVASDSADPTFNGTAGNDSANEYFSLDGGDYFTLAGLNTDFIHSLHKENAAFTWYGFLKTGAADDSEAYFGTNRVGAASGLSLRRQAGGTVTLLVSGDGGAALNVSTPSGFLDVATNYMVAVAYNEASGAGLFYRRGAAGKSTAAIAAAYSSPFATTATYILQMMAGGDGILPVGSGGRLWRSGMFNGALTETQLDALYNRYKAKLGL